jgi:hypothetical protein
MAMPPPENGKKHVCVPTRDLKRKFWSPHPLLSAEHAVFVMTWVLVLGTVASFV